MAVFRKLGDQRGEARALDDLGTTLMSKGDTAGGTAAWQQAYSLFDQLGSPKAAGVAERLAATGGPEAGEPETT
jgi:hypothetical protein